MPLPGHYHKLHDRIDDEDSIEIVTEGSPELPKKRYYSSATFNIAISLSFMCGIFFTFGIEAVTKALFSDHHAWNDNDFLRML